MVDSLNKVKQMGELRPFNDLINKITVNGKTFIPAHKIAQLSFNMNARATKRKRMMWVNEGYDMAMWYNYEMVLSNSSTCVYTIGIYRDYNMVKFIKCNDVEPPTNMGWPVCNQVKIFKKLIEWGFI